MASEPRDSFAPSAPTTTLAALVILALGLVAAPIQPASAGPNVNATLPLHAIENAFGWCDIDDPCDPGPPTTATYPGASVAIFLMVRWHEDLIGVQTAFEWPPGWTLLFGLWDCLPGQLVSHYPSASGPDTGTLTTAFDALGGGETAVVGLLHVIAGPTGCLSQIDSSHPNGSHLVSSLAEIDVIDSRERTGSVCTDRQGRAACWPAPEPRNICCRNDGGCDGDWRNCDGIVSHGECTGCEWYGACCRPDGSCGHSGDWQCRGPGDAFYVGQQCDEIECVNPVEQATWGRIKALHRD